MKRSLNLWRDPFGRPAGFPKVYNAAATPGRRGKRGLTIYLDPVAHADLKAIAENEDKLLQDLLKEGVNLVLQRYGKKPIA
jgi:hypothetical protein